jgi:hypothetical protein
MLPTVKRIAIPDGAKNVYTNSSILYRRDLESVKMKKSIALGTRLVCVYFNRSYRPGKQNDGRARFGLGIVFTIRDLPVCPSLHFLDRDKVQCWCSSEVLCIQTDSQRTTFDQINPEISAPAYPNPRSVIQVKCVVHRQPLTAAKIA